MCAPPRLALTLLRHTHLHSVFTRIVLLKTSLHDVGGVSTALDLVGVWVSTLKDVNMPMIRSAFDFEFLFDAIRVLLEGEQMQVLLKTIEFLYTGFDLLLEEQADVLRRVVRPFFFKLFLHWSPNVRRFFHHLLIFRLVRPIGWTHVVEKLPTSRVVPYGSHANLASASAPAAVSADSPSPPTSPIHADRLHSNGHHAFAPRHGPSASELSLPSCASGSTTSVDALLGGPGSSGDVVSWYEQAVADLHNGCVDRVPPDLRVYVQLSVRALDALCEQHAGVLMAASSGEPLHIPTLHWDTLLLDNEAY